MDMLYPWIKAAHLIAVIAWMAGLFYLPRLFVYHAERATPGGELDATFRVMEEKLLKVIVNPAMAATWVLGLALIGFGVIDWSEPWPWIKAVGVIAMSGFHGWCASQRKKFLAGDGAPLSGRTYRLMNEVPTLLLVVIVVAVIVRPF